MEYNNFRLYGSKTNVLNKEVEKEINESEVYIYNKSIF